MTAKFRVVLSCLQKCDKFCKQVQYSPVADIGIVIVPAAASRAKVLLDFPLGFRPRQRHGVCWWSGDVVGVIDVMVTCSVRRVEPALKFA